MPKLITRREAMDMLDQLCDDCLSMTIWEMERIDEWSKRKEEGGWFSQKQLNIIEKIFLEYMT